MTPGGGDLPCGEPAVSRLRNILSSAWPMALHTVSSSMKALLACALEPKVLCTGLVRQAHIRKEDMLYNVLQVCHAAMQCSSQHGRTDGANSADLMKNLGSKMALTGSALLSCAPCTVLNGREAPVRALRASAMCALV